MFAWNPVHVATASIYGRSSGNRPSHDRSKVPAAGYRMNTENLQDMGPLEPVQKKWQICIIRAGGKKIIIDLTGKVLRRVFQPIWHTTTVSEIVGSAWKLSHTKKEFKNDIVAD